jgi:hypothetical protein
MLDGIRARLAAVEWQQLLEHASNERIIALFTSPLGLGLLGGLLLLSALLKWRIAFAVMAASLALSFIARSTLTDTSVGPSAGMLAFAGGCVAVGAFVIYYLFIRED